MVKRTSVDMLEVGMVLGRPVYKEDMTILLGEGTVLTDDLIVSLDERGIPAVHIVVEDAEEAATPSVEDMPTLPDDKDETLPPPPSQTTHSGQTIPEKTKVLDIGYVNAYMERFADLKDIYEDAKKRGSVNVDAAKHFAASIRPLCKAATALTHIHNMEITGDYLYHHSMHVCLLAGLMGRWLRFSPEKQRQLILSALFMDIGNLRISSEILNKNRGLTPEEYRIMQKHTELSASVVHDTFAGSEKDVENAVAQHHERGDGSGYPKGLKKDEIHEFARILALLDIYDAMASKRAYADKHSPFEVFAIMSDDIMSGKLDSDFGFQFVRRVCHSLHGNWVLLSSGEQGKIVYIDESRLFSLPVVQTMTGDFVDLNRTNDIKIERILTSNELG